MRNKVAKKLKKEVAIAMYVGDDITAADVLKDRKSVYASSDFKPVYRAKKKRHDNPHYAQVVVQHPTKPGAKFKGKQKKK